MLVFNKCIKKRVTCCKP